MLRYKPENKVIVDNEERIVLHADDINEEVLTQVVTRWNAGVDLRDVQVYLDKGTNLCTVEEGDYIMEQIQQYEKQVVETEVLPEWVEPVEDRDSTVKQVVEHVIEEKVEAIIKEQTMSAGEKVDVVVATEQPKKTRTRQTSAVKAGAKVDAQTLILLYKEKAEALGYIDMVEIDEIPSMSNKGIREVLIQLQKDIDKAKEVAVQSIQQL